MEKKEEVTVLKPFVATALGQVYFVPEELSEKERMEYMADLRESGK